VRNPVYIFSSLNKRFENRTLVKPHSIDEYIDTIKEFNKFKNTKNIDNLFLIKYEDMFQDNYKNLKYIFDKIGFSYNSTIFDNSMYINKVQCGANLVVPRECPENYFHTAYRLFQINRPFVNNNDKNKICLTQIQHDILTTNIDVLEAYPENKLLIRKTEAL
jgi:hypothetical protein